MQKLNCLLGFLGRLFIAPIFLFGAFGKFTNYAVMAGYMQSKGFTNIPLLLYTAAIIELVGGVCLVIGFKTKYAAALLFLFLIPVTYFMHDFWNQTGDAQMKEMIHFLSNLAIAGGLLTVISSYSGRCSTEVNR